MKRVIAAIFVLFVSAGSGISAEKMPSDIKMLTGKITKITTDYYKSLSKVKSAKELAVVMNRYSDEMEKLGPQIKALEARYGSTENDSDVESDTPDDFESFLDDMDKLMSEKEMGEGLQKIQLYYSDPSVQKALERMSNVMEKIGIYEEADEDDNQNGYDEEGSLEGSEEE